MENPDGTITFKMLPANGEVPDAALDIQLRRPRLEELFGLWEEIDRMTAANPPPPAPVEGEPPAPSVPGRILTTMKSNVGWIRKAVATLGPPGLYEHDDSEGWRLANAAMAEPPWFVNGTVAGKWLAHWQSAP